MDDRKRLRIFKSGERDIDCYRNERLNFCTIEIDKCHIDGFHSGDLTADCGLNRIANRGFIYIGHLEASVSWKSAFRHFDIDGETVGIFTSNRGRIICRIGWMNGQIGNNNRFSGDFRRILIKPGNKAVTFLHRSNGKLTDGSTVFNCEHFTILIASIIEEGDSKGCRLFRLFITGSNRHGRIDDGVSGYFNIILIKPADKRLILVKNLHRESADGSTGIVCAIHDVGADFVGEDDIIGSRYCTCSANNDIGAEGNIIKLKRSKSIAAGCEFARHNNSTFTDFNKREGLAVFQLDGLGKVNANLDIAPVGLPVLAGDAKCESGDCTTGLAFSSGDSAECRILVRCGVSKCTRHRALGESTFAPAKEASGCRELHRADFRDVFQGFRHARCKTGTEGHITVRGEGSACQADVLPVFGEPAFKDGIRVLRCTLPGRKRQGRTRLGQLRL